MQIKIKETGETKELTAMGYKTGMEWTADLIEAGSRERDTEDDNITVMTSDDYDWWTEYINDLDKTDEEATALAEELEEVGFDPADINPREAVGVRAWIMMQIADEGSTGDYDQHRQAAINTMQRIREDHLNAKN